MNDEIERLGYNNHNTTTSTSRTNNITLSVLKNIPQFITLYKACQSWHMRILITHSVITDQKIILEDGTRPKVLDHLDEVENDWPCTCSND